MGFTDFMRNMAKPPIREINQINDLIINEPSKIIIEAEDRYSQQIKNTAKNTGPPVKFNLSYSKSKKKNISLHRIPGRG